MQARERAFGRQLPAHMPYIVYLPDAYFTEPDRIWPLILFLHGSGERGTDLSAVREHGLPKLIENGAELPFVVLAPQCPEDDWWVSYRRTLKALLEQSIAYNRIDPTRIYLTGLSMGGLGAWDLACEYPDSFAAIAPICGLIHPLLGYPERVKRIAHRPVWTFHGDRDPIVPIEHTEQMVEALRAAGGNVEFTVYPDVEHNAWTQTYENMALYDWFMQHSL